MLTPKSTKPANVECVGDQPIRIENKFLDRVLVSAEHDPCQYPCQHHQHGHPLPNLEAIDREEGEKDYGQQADRCLSDDDRLRNEKWYEERQ